MKKCVTANKKKVAFISALVLIFMLMLACNTFTEEIADDFTYHFSWSTGERIDSVADIFPSMSAHAQSINGRLVAHFFVQLFEMLPKGLFNILNSGVFVALLLLIYYFSSNKKGNILLLLSIFGAIWVFTPAFGQVYLWLDGACNYLWAAVFGLVYIIPFVNDLLFDKPIKSFWLQLVMVVAAFFVGALSENGSAGIIAISVLLQLAMIMFQHKKISWWGISSVVTGLAGFVLMISAPGTVKNKGGSGTPSFFRENFIAALEKYKLLEILLIVFCVLLAIACIKKVKKEKVILSVAFFVGSLISNFIMLAASYYPDRSMLFSTIFLITAIATLFDSLSGSDMELLRKPLMAVLALYTVFFIFVGVNDIYCTGTQLKNNEEYILSCKEEGILDIKVPMISSETKYSATKGLQYLSTEESNIWPNTSMANYFGVNSVIGYWK